jgi:hypothetical protein
MNQSRTGRSYNWQKPGNTNKLENNQYGETNAIMYKGFTISGVAGYCNGGRQAQHGKGG